MFEPAKRAAADALSPASRAFAVYLIVNLGLAPQALCCRPLRGLLTFYREGLWFWVGAVATRGVHQGG